MEGKSKMVEVLSQVTALGNKVDTEINAQEVALEKLRKEKTDLLDQQREALEGGDSAAYVSISKKIEGKQLLIEFSEKRLQKLKGRNVDREKEIKDLFSALQSAAYEDLRDIDARAITAIDALMEICDQSAGVHRAFSRAVTVLAAATNGTDMTIGTFASVGFAMEHNSLQLLYNRLKNTRQALEAEIQRGR